MKNLCICLAAFTASLAFAQAPSREFAGRWDLTVTKGDDVFPSWMDVTEKDGKLEVRAQEREGSVHPVPSEVRGKQLIVTFAPPPNPSDPSAPPRPPRYWEFTMAGKGLEGVVKVRDRVDATIRGARAPELKRAAPKAWTAPEPLFNGKDLTGWTTMNNTRNPKATENHWVVKDGVLMNEAKGQNIRTVRTFQDFKLHVEFNMDKGSNSGIYLRGRYECQMPPPAPRTDGRPPYAIYGMVAATKPVDTKPGEWHTYDMRLIGRHVTLAVDGVTIVENQEIAGITGGALDSHEAEPGPIYFQGDHTGGLRFRNITISVPKR